MLQSKSNLEIKLDNCNHIMELIRTLVPIVILVLQVIILVKLICPSRYRKIWTFRSLGEMCPNPKTCGGY